MPDGSRTDLFFGTRTVWRGVLESSTKVGQMGV